MRLHPLTLLHSPKSPHLTGHPSAFSSSSSVVRIGQVKVDVKHGLITVCAWCNRVRDTDYEWHQLDTTTLQEAVKQNCTHTICRDCMHKLDFSE